MRPTELFYARLWNLRNAAIPGADVVIGPCGPSAALTSAMAILQESPQARMTALAPGWVLSEAPREAAAEFRRLPPHEGNPGAPR
jgi:hypothetical protein